MPSRIIKESICVSRKLNSLTPEEEVFFYRLLVNCDDYGCFYGDPLVLAGKMFPRRPCTAKQVKAWRDRVAQVGLILVYRVDGEEYIEVQAWHEHQRQRTMRRRYPERDPLTNDGQMTADCGQMSDTCPQNAASVARAESESESESESIPNPISRKRDNAPAKTAYGTFRNVHLTDEEFLNLGPEAGDMIDRLSEYKESTGKKYKNDYATILAWQRRDSGSTRATASGGGRPTNQIETFAALARKLERGEEI